jgi:hypothetical protein
VRSFCSASFLFPFLSTAGVAVRVSNTNISVRVVKVVDGQNSSGRITQLGISYVVSASARLYLCSGVTTCCCRGTKVPEKLLNIR